MFCDDKQIQSFAMNSIDYISDIADIHILNFNISHYSLKNFYVL